MTNVARYPSFNDLPHPRPVLTAYGNSLLGEFVWIAIPVAVFVLALLIR
ncbi:MAG: hypothetical protein HYZ35_03485 [Chloroflexi bacterium]|nr:hypothetical protein [Chloroflexota bacterium]MBI3177032.1 hypothetical protein [Chloroflexota bacterium]